MNNVDASVAMEDRRAGEVDRAGRRPPAVATGSGEGGFLHRYKPEQGKWIRGGTFAGALALILWGGWFLYEKLEVFSGDEWWQLLITMGIPLVFTAALAALAWWLAWTKPEAGDFFVATEGEMKKVSWSTRRELIGSTKVVIVITLLLAAILFMIDWLFIQFFRWVGVLRI